MVLQYNTVQYNTTLLSLRREICLLAHHLHKTFSTFYSKNMDSSTEGDRRGGGVVDIVRFCQQAVVDCGEIKIPPPAPVKCGFQQRLVL